MRDKIIKDNMTVIGKRKKLREVLMYVLIGVPMLVLLMAGIYSANLVGILFPLFFIGFCISQLVVEIKKPRDIILVDDSTGEIFLAIENIRIKPNNIVSVLGDSTKSLDGSGVLTINTVKSSYKCFNVCNVEQVANDIITIAEAYREKHM